MGPNPNGPRSVSCDRAILGISWIQYLNVPWSRLSRFVGDGKPPTFNDGILIMGPYKPLRTWVDEFIPYGNVTGVETRPWHAQMVS